MRCRPCSQPGRKWWVVAAAVAATAGASVSSLFSSGHIHWGSWAVVAISGAAAATMGQLVQRGARNKALKAGSAAGRSVTLYMTEGQPASEEARRQLEDLRGQLNFKLNVVDVSLDPSLRDRGLTQTPAVAVRDRLLPGKRSSAELADFITMRE